jgi:hypothetical protein
MVENIAKGLFVIVAVIMGNMVYDKIKPNPKFQLCGKNMTELHLSNHSEKNGECIQLGNTFGATVDDNGNIILPSSK